jgi:tRNA dimethylallyltransferase
MLSGGSMMYIDAVCNGIDEIPTVNDDVRSSLKQRYQEEGIDKMLAELKLIDPLHYDTVDHKNWKRIIHALEIFYTTGKPYSSFLTRKTLRNIDKKTNTTNRPFRILKIGLERPREELFERINSRVDAMINSGLLHEAMTLYKHRNKNALNTVGYKEMFNVLDGTWELPMAIERIKKNTRVYAKKQLTWFKHDNEIKWFHPDNIEEIHKYIERNL